MRYVSRVANSPRAISFLIISVTIVSDQLSKFLASRYFDIYCNEGFGFGIRVGQGKEAYISLVLLAYLIYILFTEKRKTAYFSLSLVLAGGASNLIDRVVLGCTRDFINFGIFPSFNFADSAISIGIILYLYQFIKRKE